jgi:hypothetical protein
VLGSVGHGRRSFLFIAAASCLVDWITGMTWALVVGIAILSCGNDGKDMVTVKTYSFPVFDSYQACYMQGKRTKSGFTCTRI